MGNSSCCTKKQQLGPELVFYDLKDDAKPVQREHSLSSAQNILQDLDLLEMNNRRENERKKVQLLDRHSLRKGACIYIIDKDWMKEWSAFVLDSKTPPPGPITNDHLLDAAGNVKPNLMAAKHYRGLGKELWEFFMSTYGGGPVIKRTKLDIYSEPADDEDDEDVIVPHLPKITNAFAY
eukprot:GILJ01009846.1.p1 GENE.GILJ01009846.1~~GILJ01009846.1.p1  ORF type:complete len:179 (+),score=19.95 GILJ01009846.1:46-582(+)